MGGGLGRTPFVGKSIRSFLPTEHVLSYCEAILRVYNQLGRRDNKYKARIKITLHEMGAEAFTELVEKEGSAFARAGSRCPPKRSSGSARTSRRPRTRRSPTTIPACRARSERTRSSRRGCD